jgi:membrane protease YdiL (CAAX protease family)
LKRAGILVLFLALGWVATWLSLGLAHGDPTVLLRPGTTDSLRIPYLVMLYAWLLVATRLCWARWGPPRPSLKVSAFFTFLALGLGLLAVQRSLLWVCGWWTPPTGIDLRLLLLASITSPLLAVAEELVFRGYLFGVVREERGELIALVGVNLFFALLHLFRPGDLWFKLVYGVGLWLAGAVLTLAYRCTGQLSAPMGLHTSWILVSVLDPPGRVTPGWLPGLRGDPAAGLVGWAFLMVMAWGLGRRSRKEASND